MRCSYCGSLNTKKNGTYITPQHGRVQKYFCKSCKQDFSQHTEEFQTKDHKPELNEEVIDLYKKGLSEREISKQLGCARLTVRRKMSKYL